MRRSRSGRPSLVLTRVRICTEQNHTWQNMIFEKMLVRNTSFHKSDALLLDKLLDQNVEVGHFLVRSGKTMVYDEMDFFGSQN